MDIEKKLKDFEKFKEDLRKSGVESGSKAYEEACEEYMGIASSSSSEDEDFKKIGKDIDNIGGQNNQPSQERK